MLIQIWYNSGSKKEVGLAVVFFSQIRPVLVENVVGVVVVVL